MLPALGVLQRRFEHVNDFPEVFRNYAPDDVALKRLGGLVAPALRGPVYHLVSAPPEKFSRR
ncbi:hypothetical protein [Micromonospora aurantiaca]|uniref:hypothetical protein n=1 Tax=Micromonospora aurantiaca (nom. illeg.) TaxID=47850 RepID=UPI00380E4379